MGVYISAPFSATTRSNRCTCLNVLNRSGSSRPVTRSRHRPARLARSRAQRVPSSTMPSCAIVPSKSVASARKPFTTRPARCSKVVCRGAPPIPPTDAPRRQTRHRCLRAWFRAEEDRPASRCRRPERCSPPRTPGAAGCRRPAASPARPRAPRRSSPVLAETVGIRLAGPVRQAPEFERDDDALGDQRRPEPCAQAEKQHPSAVVRAQCLHRRVVQTAGRDGRTRRRSRTPSIPLPRLAGSSVAPDGPVSPG